ncbi:MAG TPA: hypothetical protein PLU30_19120, partial [Verrucomicrobiae bacterium]|nr:hypothetical protein [Verrucomicrobiae bacterium]
AENKRQESADRLFHRHSPLLFIRIFSLVSGRPAPRRTESSETHFSKRYASALPRQRLFADFLNRGRKILYDL